MANIQNITIDRANTQTVSINARTEGSFSAINPGDTLYFTAKPKYDNDETDSSAVISKDMSAGEVIDPETEVATFKITAREANIEPAKYVYDLTVQQDDGDRRTITKGKLTVSNVATLRGIA